MKTEGISLVTGTSPWAWPHWKLKNGEWPSRRLTVTLLWILTDFAFFTEDLFVMTAGMTPGRIISNLGHFASCLAFTDTNYNESYAPVGEERGVVKLVEGLDFNVAETRGLQDLFSNSGINYLQITRNQGSRKALFWEQFTTQLGVSPFRDLNVVRFMTLVRKP